ncbi:MAG: hypothetical protein PHP31_07055 [Lentimicrobiaceae bacterium]|nr:hypothetical protein [Lentimicrobiaceae bacterium]
MKNKLVTENIIRFVLLLVLQVLILNKINLFGYLHPNAYILFILLLPFETPGWLLLILAFVTGLSVDVFEGVMGIHTIATVFAAFIRPYVIRAVGNEPEYGTNAKPGIFDMKLSWFLYYAAIIIFLHQFILNLLDAFSFKQFFLLLWRTILNSILTLIFAVILQYIFPPYTKKK